MTSTVSYTEDQMKPLLDRVAAGEPLNQVATDSQVSPNTLLKHVRQAGIQRLRPDPKAISASLKQKSESVKDSIADLPPPVSPEATPQISTAPRPKILIYDIETLPTLAISGTPFPTAPSRSTSS